MQLKRTVSFLPLFDQSRASSVPLTVKLKACPSAAGGAAIKAFRVPSPAIFEEHDEVQGTHTPSGTAVCSQVILLSFPPIRRLLVSWLFVISGSNIIVCMKWRL